MNTVGIHNIIFDLGGVIINIDPTKTIDYFAKATGIDSKAMHLRMEEAEVFHKYESGMLSDIQFVELLHDVTGKKLGTDQILEGWNSLLLDIPSHKVDVIKELGTSFSVFLLSNTNHIHFLEVENILRQSSDAISFTDIMDDVFLSYQLKMRKPEHRIYRHPLEKHNLKPEETLFIDDNEVNIRAAAAVGMKTLLYTGGPVNLFGYAF